MIYGIYRLYYIFHQINIYSINIYIMFLSLNQQVNNTNNDLSSFESKLNELKDQTNIAISFHNNFIKSDENIKIIVNTTTCF